MNTTPEQIAKAKEALRKANDAMNNLPSEAERSALYKALDAIHEKERIAASNWNAAYEYYKTLAGPEEASRFAFKVRFQGTGKEIMNGTFILLITRDGIEKVEEIPEWPLLTIYRRPMRNSVPLYKLTAHLEAEVSTYKLTGEKLHPQAYWTPVPLPVYREEE